MHVTIEINLQECEAACHILSKRLQKMQAYICLIQEPWFFKGQLWDVNSMDSQLVYHRGRIRPRAAVFIKGIQCRIVPGFVTLSYRTQSKNPNIASEYEWEESILIDNWPCSIDTYRYFIISILPITSLDSISQE